VEVGMNFYAVLGVPRDANEETIRSAYRILARRYHPDRGAGSSAEKFRMVNEAYETLIDPGSRRSHDLSLEWTEHQVPVQAEPMVVQSAPFPQEDADVFGRFRAAPPSGAFRISGDFDELLDRWFHSFDSVFSAEWPW
jgi:curved DNA-binding protein CbpA